MAGGCALSHAEDPKRNSTLFVIDSATGDIDAAFGRKRNRFPATTCRLDFRPTGATISYIRHIGRTEQELRLVPFGGGPAAQSHIGSKTDHRSGLGQTRQVHRVRIGSDRRVPVMEE